jgi:small subunit ribosomal protein S16
VAVKIKLKRLGKIRAPHYRIIVADARTKRDGRAIEEIGKYRPKEDPSFIEVDSERVQYWLGVGAQPTDPVLAILKITGDWQKFKGEPGAEGTLKAAEPKPRKREVFEAAVKEVQGEAEGKATTPKSKKKAEPKKAKKAEAAKKDDAKAAEPAPAEGASEAKSEA